MIIRTLDQRNEPLSGAENMALDQWLLENFKNSGDLDRLTSSKSDQLCLRSYSWREPTVSFGYFVKISEIPPNFQPLARVRRWTGGGVVDHRHDWTFSLIAPEGHPLAALRPAESYGFIHAALAAMLNELGLAATMAPASEFAGNPLGSGCFQNPVAADVLVAGQKVAGGAQRRTRNGLLHQGSIQNVALSAEWFEIFAEKLLLACSQRFGMSGSIQPLVFPPEKWLEVQEIAQRRYASPAWTERC